MITHYHRPTNLKEALALLNRPNTQPLGGGTTLNPTGRNPALEIEVVDLQALGWNHLRKHGNNLEIDACVSLEHLLENAHCPEALKQAIRQEAPLNIRTQATVAGRLVASDGISPFATAMLALDAKLTIDEDTTRNTRLGEYLAVRRLPGKLISKISIPLYTGLIYEQVSRTPADAPILCVALAQWSSGRTRLAVGGWGRAPHLALDGTEPIGLGEAAQNACHESGDERASAAYRMDVAATLARRCAERLEKPTTPAPSASNPG